MDIPLHTLNFRCALESQVPGVLNGSAEISSSRKVHKLLRKLATISVEFLPKGLRSVYESKGPRKGIVLSHRDCITHRHWLTEDVP